MRGTRPIRTAALAAAFACLTAPAARAEEGMWMPQQIPDLEKKLKDMGFTGDANAFADLTGYPMGAVVSLGGCSASFVSPDALIVTNHHCIQGALQFNSKPEKNLLKDGFLARTKEEELSNGPGSRVFVTTAVTEVTKEITGGIDSSMPDRKRYDLIDKRVKERTAQCEKSGLRCRVASFFGGLKYFELAQMEIQDVRLVYAPDAGIGVFGGETDNWQWPRHTGDFSFYRAYVSKDGKAVPYSKDNVPYKPKHFLKVSPQGANPGDLVFVAGYPGRTERHQTYQEVKSTTEWSYPLVIRRYTDYLAILDEVSKGNPETAIRVATKVRGYGNSLTNRKGMLQGLVKGGILQKKEQADRELRAWIDADAGRKKAYGNVLPELDRMEAEDALTRDRDSAFGALYAVSGYLSTADQLYRLSLERGKKDLDREPEFQERNWTRLKEAADRAQRSYDRKADRALMRYVMMDVAKLSATQRVAGLDKAFGLSAGMDDKAAAAAIDAKLEALFGNTKIDDKEFRLGLFDKKTADILATKEPFVELAVALHPFGEEQREKRKAQAGAAQRLRPLYMKALLEKSGGLVAPDANSTLRVTFGRVQGVTPRDGMIYTAQTTMQGIVDKATGTGDFNAPKKQLDAIAAFKSGKKPSMFADPRLGDVPVNYLSSVDTTGGNSGSATINAKGELVGLLFDGTFDTIASDFLYDPVKTRSIHVDTRYMLWVMSEVDGATNLLDELGVTSKVNQPKM